MNKSIFFNEIWLVYPTIFSAAPRQQGSSVLRVAVALRRFEERSAKGTMPPFPPRSGVEVVQGVAGAASRMSVDIVGWPRTSQNAKNPELFLGFCL